MGVVPGHARAGESGGDGGDGRDDLDLQAELGGPQGAYDAEEAGVAVGEDDRGAPVGGDAAGGEGHAAETDAFGGGRHLGEREVVGGAGHEGGRTQCGACRGGQRRTVPADHRDPVGHRRQSPGVLQVVSRKRSRARLVRLPGAAPGRGDGTAGPMDQFQSVKVLKPASSVSGPAAALEVFRQQAPHDEVGAHVRPPVLLGADAGYAGVAQDALADAADLLGDLLGGGVVGGGAQFDALELLVAEEPLGGGERRPDA